jgi:hypothetical protein
LTAKDGKFDCTIDEVCADKKEKAMTDPERKLIEAARQVAEAADLLGNSDKLLSKVSRDTARRARIDVREAIELLQTFEHLLTRRVMS